MKEQKLKLWMGVGVATLLASSGAWAGDGGEGGESGHDDMVKSADHGGEGGESGESYGGEGGENQGGEGGESQSHGGEGGEGGENHGGATGEAFSYFAAGGEGGEGGEGGSSTAPALSDGAQIAMIHMMQGHLMAARELIKSGEVAEGRPHLTHPWIEVYPMVESGLEAHGQNDLGKRLKALAEKAKDVDKWSDVSADFNAIWKSMDKALATIAGDQPESPATVAKVTLSLTKQAVLEYDEAQDDGRFVAEYEYQDGRGFVMAAREYLERNKAALMKQNKEAWRDSNKVLDELEKAWPTAVPPAQPVVKTSDLYATQARLELALSPYLY